MDKCTTKIVFVGVAALGLYIMACNTDLFMGPSGFRGIHQAHAGNILVTRSRVNIYEEVRPATSAQSNVRIPRCLKWYAVRQGDTQWSIATRFATQPDKKEWIRSMLWVSGKPAGDSYLAINEKLCVGWG